MSVEHGNAQSQDPLDDGKGRTDASERRCYDVLLTPGRQFATSCPMTPNRYCDLISDWAQRVNFWMLEAREDVKDCCEEDIGEPSDDRPRRRCDDWQSAWSELQGWAKKIRPFLKGLEHQTTECTGTKIFSQLPTPVRGPLRSSGADEQLDEACRRARNYFAALRKWGAEVAKAFNDHCSTMGPTHLSDPPDPPF